MKEIKNKINKYKFEFWGELNIEANNDEEAYKQLCKETYNPKIIVKTGIMKKDKDIIALYNEKK